MKSNHDIDPSQTPIESDHNDFFDFAAWERIHALSDSADFLTTEENTPIIDTSSTSTPTLVYHSSQESTPLLISPSMTTSPFSPMLPRTPIHAELMSQPTAEMPANPTQHFYTTLNHTTIPTRRAKKTVAETQLETAPPVKYVNFTFLLKTKKTVTLTLPVPDPSLTNDALTQFNFTFVNLDVGKFLCSFKNKDADIIKKLLSIFSVIKFKSPSSDPNQAYVINIRSFLQYKTMINKLLNMSKENHSDVIDLSSDFINNQLVSAVTAQQEKLTSLSNLTNANINTAEAIQRQLIEAASLQIKTTVEKHLEATPPAEYNDFTFLLKTKNIITLKFPVPDPSLTDDALAKFKFIFVGQDVGDFLSYNGSYKDSQIIKKLLSTYEVRKFDSPSNDPNQAYIISIKSFLQYKSFLNKLLSYIKENNVIDLNSDFINNQLSSAFAAQHEQIIGLQGLTNANINTADEMKRKYVEAASFQLKKTVERQLEAAPPAEYKNFIFLLKNKEIISVKLPIPDSSLNDDVLTKFKFIFVSREVAQFFIGKTNHSHNTDGATLKTLLSIYSVEKFHSPLNDPNQAYIAAVRSFVQYKTFLNNLLNYFKENNTNIIDLNSPFITNQHRSALLTQQENLTGRQGPTNANVNTAEAMKRKYADVTSLPAHSAENGTSNATGATIDSISKKPKLGQTSFSFLPPSLQQQLYSIFSVPTTSAQRSAPPPVAPPETDSRSRPDQLAKK